MHAPLAKFSMMRRLMSSAAWWLNSSAIDLDFAGNRAHDGIPVDPLLASTVLMLHGDGVDASTNISDSTGRHFCAVNGSAQTDTAQSKFGGSSLFFNTGGTDCVSIDTSNGDFTFGTGDFTIDCWVRFADNTAVQPIYDGRGVPDNEQIFLTLLFGPLVLRNNGSTVINSGVTPSTGVWYHIALTRASGTTRLFIDGTQVGSSFSDSTNYLLRTPLRIGGDGATNYARAWIDELRVIKGVAAWTTTFTPPTMPYNVGVGPYDLLSCSRASIGYAQTAAGTLTQFAANQLRITDLGLLVEDARTNLLNQSADFSTTWTADQATVTTNQATAPDGTVTMDKIVDAATTDRHIVYQQTATFTVGSTCTLSVYVKDIDRRYVWLTMVAFGAAGSIFAVADLQTGTITDSGLFNATGSTFIGASIEALAGGIYRISVTGSHTGVTSYYAMVCLSDRATNTGSFTGDCPSYLGSGKGIYAWGAQFELGAFPSSYIPTTSSSATRAGDVVKAVGSAQAAFGAAEATGLADVITTQSSISNTKIIDDPVEGKQIVFFNSNTQISGYGHGGVTLGNSLTARGGVKVGWSNSIANGTSLVGGGGTVNNNASNYNVDTNAQLSSADAYNLYGYFRRVTVWTSRLADADLQALTSPTGPSPTNYAVDLNFQTGAYTVNARPQFYLSCSRASVGYAQTVAGTLTQFPANQLRITDQGLLVEDARTNSAGNSQTFDNWNINASQVTVTADNTAAPDGTVTADKLLINTFSSVALMQCDAVSHSFVAGTVCTASLYLKGSSPWQLVWMMQFGFTHAVKCWFNISTGVVGSNAVAGDGVFDSAQIEALANGWFRVILSGHFTSSAGGEIVLFPCVAADGSQNSVLNDFVYAWGAQLETGAFPSSYIPTTTVAATRAADDIHNEAVVKTIVSGAIASIRIDCEPAKDDVSVGDSYLLKWSADSKGLKSLTSNTDKIRLTNTAGSAVADAVLPSGTVNTVDIKYAGAWDGSGGSAVMNGGTVATSSNVMGTATTTSYFGCSDSGNTTWNNYFRRYTLWTSRLADATLQGFTNP